MGGLPTSPFDSKCGHVTYLVKKKKKKCTEMTSSDIRNSCALFYIFLLPVTEFWLWDSVFHSQFCHFKTIKKLPWLCFCMYIKTFFYMSAISLLLWCQNVCLDLFSNIYLTLFAIRTYFQSAYLDCFLIFLCLSPWEFKDLHCGGQNLLQGVQGLP